MKPDIVNALTPKLPALSGGIIAQAPTRQRDRVAQECVDRYNYSASAFGKWRKEAKQFYKAYATDPWPNAEKNRLEDAQRINAVFSFCTKIINAVIGQDQGDRKEVRFGGINEEPLSGFLGDMFTRLVRSIFQKSDGHRKDTAVYEDMLITGYGWGQVYIDNLRKNQQIRVNHIEAWEIYPDPDARDDGLEDAEYIIREHWMTPVMASLRWPDVDWERYGEPSQATTTAPFPRVVSADAYFDDDAADLNVQSRMTRRDGGIKILEYQRYVYERWAEYDDGSGTKQMLPEKDYKAMLKEMASQVDPTTGAPISGPIEGIIRFRRMVRRAFVAFGYEGNHELLEDEQMDIDEFTYKCATALREKDMGAGRVVRFGLMKLAYDPQLWASRAISLMLEMLGRQSKGGVDIEEGAVKDQDDFEARYSTPGAVLWYNAGALSQGKVRDRTVPNLPSGLNAMFGMAVDAISKTTNVGDYLTGAATSERSNVLISNLQNQQLAALNPFSDQMSGYRMRIGQLIAKVAQATMTAQAIDKILGNPMVEGITAQTDEASGEQQQIASAGAILKENDVLELKVQVDTGTASPTARQAFWESLTDAGLMQQIMQQAPASVPKILPMFFRFSPLPTEIGETLAKDLEAALKQPKLEEEMGRYQRMKPEDQQQLIVAALQQMDPMQAQGLVQQALPQEEQQEGETQQEDQQDQQQPVQ